MRPSALAWVGRCPVKAVLAMGEPEDEGGPAAQTGSLVHAAIAAFHLEPDESKRVAAAVATLQTAAAKFPRSDPTDARIFTEAYICDPRNATAQFVTMQEDRKRRDGTILRAGQPAIEVPVSLKLAPHRIDPTGEPIYVAGTLDQIRIENCGELIWDYKSGKPSGLEMIHDYAIQQASYWCAARASGFPDIGMGGLIRGMSYRARGAVLPSPAGVFWSMPFNYDGATALLARVRLHVALIRMGEIDFGPASWCTYCEQKGLDSCIPTANKKLFSLPMVNQ